MMGANGRGKVITFYSFKGGVGRSMALANVAALLAQRGKKVLALDFDFEAPGLHRYFLSTGATSFTRYEPRGLQQGVIDFFYALRDRLREEWPDGVGIGEPTARDRIVAIIAPILDSGAYLYRVRLKNPNVRKAPPAEIQFMPAARFDESYAARVRSFDWQTFYETYAEVFPVLAAELGKRYDHVLIDSRTGVTDIGSVCTMLLPDKLVLVFSPNDQSLDGALEAGWQSVQQRKASEEDSRPLPIFPLLSRLENSEETLKNEWVDKARGQFEGMFRGAYALDSCDLETYFKLVRIPHHSFYAYGEKIATEQQAAIETGSLAQAFHRFAECLDYESALEAQNMLEHTGGKEENPVIDQAVLQKILEDEGLVRESIRMKPDEPSIRLWLAKLLREQNRTAEAIDVYSEVIHRFGDVEGLGLRKAVLTAMLGNGELLYRLGRHENSINMYDEVIARFGHSNDYWFREQVAKALVNKGVVLGALNQYENALATYDKAIARFDHSTQQQWSREEVAKALVNKGAALGSLRRHEEALVIWDEAIVRFSPSTDLSLRELVAHALLNKAGSLSLLSRNEEAVAICTEILTRYGNEAEPTLRKLVAKALLKKAACLCDLSRYESALVTYDEVLTRASDPTERELITKALLGKAVNFIYIGQNDNAVLTYEEVIRRVEDASAPKEQEAVVQAIKGIGFARLCAAKHAWQGGDEPAARALLEDADAKIAAALERQPDNPIILGNAGYIAFLRGDEEKAHALLCRAIQLGGEELRNAELKDADMHPLPQDDAFRALVRSFPSSAAQAVNTAPSPPALPAAPAEHGLVPAKAGETHRGGSA